jgi:hypothetical protein
MKWIALKEGEELRDRDIVTRTIRGAGGTNQLDVTLGYPMSTHLSIPRFPRLRRR